MTIRSLDDITLAPTPVTVVGGGVKERLQASILTAFEGKKQPMTLVASSAMTAEPFARIVRFGSATIGPRPVGGYSPWQLSLHLYEKQQRKGFDLAYDFPALPVILILGAHALDFAEICRMPMQGREDHRFRDESYPAFWRDVSALSADIAGPENILIDTTDAAGRDQIGWLQAWRAV